MKHQGARRNAKRAMNLESCVIGSDGSAELGRALSVNAALEVLSLRRNYYIGNNGATTLADVFIVVLVLWYW
jgi:hypothetical protein